MIIKKGNKMIKFIKQKCGTGSIYSFELQNEKQSAYVARVREEETQGIQELFCHTNMRQAKEAAERLGMNIKDDKDTMDCQDYKVCKSKQKKIAKVDKTRSENPGEQLCIDTSSMKTPNARNKY